LPTEEVVDQDTADLMMSPPQMDGN
jgi:hypothetical protein